MSKENNYKKGYINNESGRVFIEDKNRNLRHKGNFDKETGDVYSVSKVLCDVITVAEDNLGNVRDKVFYRNYTFFFGCGNGEEKAGYINEKNEIVCINNFTNEERIIGQLRGKPENALAYFATRFVALEEKINDFVDEYRSTNDKASCLLKIKHQYEILANYNALGDFEKLAKKIKDLESESQREWNIRYNLKSELLKQAAYLANYSDDFFQARLEFYGLLKQWREAGPLPGEKGRLLGQNWFENSKIFFEKAENQEYNRVHEKQKIISQARDWVNNPNLKLANQKLKEFSQMYKDIGGIFNRDKRTELDDDFYGMLKIFSERKTEHYSSVMREKQEIVREISGIIDSGQKWKEKDEKIKELKEKFKSLGFSGNKEEDQALWDEMQGKIEIYWEDKNKYFEKRKNENQDAKDKKERIIDELKKIIDGSETFKEKDERIKELREEFKSAGSVGSKEENQALWNEFSEIANDYWEDKNKYFETKKQESINWKKNKIEELEEKIEHWEEVIGNLRPGRRAEEIEESLQEKIDNTKERISKLQEDIDNLEN